MSIQNSKTIEAYQIGAKKYLMCNNIISNSSFKDKKIIQNFIKKTLKIIPSGSSVLEVGSADGEMSKYIKELGYRFGVNYSPMVYRLQTLGILEDEFDPYI